MLWRIVHPAHSLYALRTYPRDCGPPPRSTTSIDDHLPPNGAQKEVHDDELMISSDDVEECVEIESSGLDDGQNENDVFSWSTSTRQLSLPADTHSPGSRLRYCFRRFPKGCGPPSRFTSSAADDYSEEELELVVSSDDEEECVEIESSELEGQTENDVAYELVSSSTSTRQLLLHADTISPPRRLRYCFRLFPKGCGPPSRFTSSAADDHLEEEELELVVSSDDEVECVDFETSIEPESKAGNVDETSSQLLSRKRRKINRYQRSQVKKLVQRALNTRFRHGKSSSNISTGSDKRQRIEELKQI